MSPLTDALTRPAELLALLNYKFLRPSAVENPAVAADGTVTNKARFVCYNLLNRTSRSFSAVIKELDEELMDPVCLFYVILRALDTVEDDMTLPVDRKIFVLQHFHEYIFEEGWHFTESGPNEKDRDVLVEFHVIIEFFLQIKPRYQQVIADITRRMGHGMAEFCTRRVESKADYDLYCHYVAGLVGIGLSSLFAASGLEGKPASNSMGLFLQKTNIIRDFLEDHIEGRLFWPREIWSQYADDPEVFRDASARDKALACLNHMCLDAFAHIPDAIEYMSMIRNQTVFNFCAIPQVMAISTLALVFNNPQVFEQNVKIRKGLACKLIIEAQDMSMVRGIFLDFLNEISRKNTNASDPNFIKLSTTIAQVGVAAATSIVAACSLLTTNDAVAA
ncbi:farnesyl-diphosphate farnesyltransferase [Syncephalis pseudoplumigaleata]|uniref:Squalene synthase n=1 Tax=Syncephalis pseudoplumigaleata TaxID=1712513 RepID=A0A4P9Z2W1_9FUNG|nr:farnesyl-diphosphate farnesyltransferase [Syncephalis pseudoplumigaleata]|eukprot:RKP26708.1 farnesyl-diphosphate farnesyltransferase [Syncephalis pseudoplumigaleata]